MLDVLVTAVLRLSHAALGPMAERGHGGVINVSSVAAFLPRGSYSAAKAWVNSFSEWAANEYRPRGVTVMALCPGFTKTEFHERMDVGRGSAPAFMWLDADKLVATALSDFDKGRVYSIPSPQYKAIAAVSRAGPEQGAAAVPVDRPQIGRRQTATGVARPERALAAVGESEQPLVLVGRGGVAAELVVVLAEAVVVAGARHHQGQRLARSRAAAAGPRAGGPGGRPRARPGRARRAR